MTSTEDSSTWGPNLGPAMGSKSRTLGYYVETLSEIPAESRRLVRDYCHVPDERVIDHISTYRDQFWDVYPYPCVGMFRFVELTLRQQERYSSVVDRIKDGARFLDIGLAAGQDMRNLVLDGCPSDNMFAIEIEDGYIDVAYRFWRDKETLRTHFIISDLFDDTEEDAQALDGTVDIVHVSQVLHLFDLETQTRACERFAKFTKAGPGSLVIGNSVGRQEAGLWRGPNGKVIFKHDNESFAKMWEEVGKRTGTSWKVKSTNPPMPNMMGAVSVHYEDPTTTRLTWEVERV